MNDDERIEIRDARRRDFFIVDNVIIDHYGSIIGPFAVLTYVSLCRHADCSTRETYPSLSLIAKELGISRMTVIRSIQKLITHGLIVRKYRKSKSGDPDTNIYIILEPWGSHSQRLPKKTEMLQPSNSSVEVVTHSDQVVTHSDQGSHSQGLGVVTHSDTNNTYIEQDSENKTKDITTTPSVSAPKKKVREPKVQSLCPSDYQPSESVQQGILEDYPGVNIPRLVKRMKDWSASKGEMRRDWNATLRTFADKNWEDRGSPSNQPRKPKFVE